MVTTVSLLPKLGLYCQLILQFPLIISRATVTNTCLPHAGIGAASRPSGRDIDGIPTYGLTALEREMSTPPTLHLDRGPLYLPVS